MSYYLTNLYCIVLVCFFIGCKENNDLKWNDEDIYKWAEVNTSYFNQTGFEKLDSTSTDINFINRAFRESIVDNRNYLNGSGVAAADIDDDGLVDLYFAQLDGPNKLYKNLGGMQFEDITEEAGLEHKGYNSTGVVFADANGDGDQDLLITSLTKENALYINDGKGKFKLEENSGLGDSKGSTSMTLADIDGDGDLDLYITNYKLKTVRDIYSADQLTLENTTKKQGDSLIVIPPFDKYYGMIHTDNRSYRNEYGAKDELYINNGEGFFEKVDNPEKSFLDQRGNPKGLSRDWGLTAKFHDINGDMLPDLYVANDFWTPDRIWINKGDGTFQEIDKFAISNQSYSSMGVAFSDINKDGHVDIFVSEMLSAIHKRKTRQLSQYLDPINGRPQFNRNSLYTNRGDNTFAEISYYSGLEASEWSWATIFLDVDLDGYEDLILTTGHSYDYQDMDTQRGLYQNRNQNTQENILFDYPPLRLENKIFINNQDLTFTDKSNEYGFLDKDVSHGMAVADLDNDGDPDLAINRLNDQALIYENRSNAPRIAVRLNGRAPNTSAIGAKVILNGTDVVQQKEISAGGVYVSGSQPMIFFAADGNNKEHEIEVTWPNGNKSKIDNVKANRVYVIDEKQSKDKAEKNKREIRSSTPLFKDVSGKINHIHHEDFSNDFNVQPLLPVKLNRRGPGVAWFDFDGDNHDDLFIPSGTGRELSIFKNDGNGRFQKTKLGKISSKAFGDQTTVLGWNEENKSNLIVGSANYEQGDPNVPSAYYHQIDPSSNIESEIIPGILSTTGPLALADYNSDGEIDLFVGGNFLPLQYPKDATSRFFSQKSDDFILDEINSDLVSEVGLVSGVVFTDYDQDGDLDLLLSREWDSILLLENRNGKFVDVSKEVGLDSYKGWWNGIATGDFNNDGLPDIIATNIGENSIYQIKDKFPLRLFYSDFNGDGRLDIIDSYYDKNAEGYVPRRKLYEFDSLPGILRNVKSHRDFSNLTVDEIIGQSIETIPYKELNTLKHVLLINEGDHFTPFDLPAKAQWSIAYDVSVADFNNDGNEDIFMSQNFTYFPPGTPVLDGGRGALLLGDGQGNFQFVPGHESGIKINNDQRGAAVSDFNNDGKVDLAVSQNAGETKLFQNRTTKRGISIQLTGSTSNPDAIGSSVRLIYEDGSKGPLREIQAGSGYWSQNSFIQVLGISGTPKQLEIRWFDGKKVVVDLTETNLMYEFSY